MKISFRHIAVLHVLLVTLVEGRRSRCPARSHKAQQIIADTSYDASPSQPPTADYPASSPANAPPSTAYIDHTPGAIRPIAWRPEDWLVDESDAWTPPAATHLPTMISSLPVSAVQSLGSNGTPAIATTTAALSDLDTTLQSPDVDSMNAYSNPDSSPGYGSNATLNVTSAMPSTVTPSSSSETPAEDDGSAVSASLLAVPEITTFGYQPQVPPSPTLASPNSHNTIPNPTPAILGSASNATASSSDASEDGRGQAVSPSLLTVPLQSTPAQQLGHPASPTPVVSPASSYNITATSVNVTTTLGTIPYLPDSTADSGWISPSLLVAPDLPTSAYRPVDTSSANTTTGTSTFCTSTTVTSTSSSNSSDSSISTSISGNSTSTSTESSWFNSTSSSDLEGEIEDFTPDSGDGTEDFAPDGDDNLYSTITTSSEPTKPANTAPPAITLTAISLDDIKKAEEAANPPPVADEGSWVEAPTQIDPPRLARQVNCSTSGDAVLSDCRALLDDEALWNATFTLDPECDYWNPHMSMPPIRRVAKNLACHQGCCIYYANCPEMEDEDQIAYFRAKTRVEAQSLLGCGVEEKDSVNVLGRFGENAICVSDRKGCGDCFGDSDFAFSATEPAWGFDMFKMMGRF